MMLEKAGSHAGVSQFNLLEENKTSSDRLNGRVTGNEIMSKLEDMLRELSEVRQEIKDIKADLAMGRSMDEGTVRDIL